MRWLLVSDIHLSPKGGEEYRWLVFDEIHSILDKQAMTHVLFLGDYTDFKDGHDSALVNRFSDEIRKIADKVPVLMLGGNHDTVNEVGYHFFSFLDNYSNVTFISTPISYEIDGKNALFLPHARNPHAAWKHLDFDEFDYIFMHQTVIGSKTSDRFMMTEGLRADIFKDTTAQIFSGDIHVPQCVGPVTYIGAPVRLRYGDSYSPRMLILSETKYDVYSMDHLPTKHKVVISKASDLENIDIRKGDQVKVVCTLGDSEFVGFNEIRADVLEAINAAGAESAGIELKRRERVRLLDKKVDTLFSGTHLQVISSYAEKEKLSDSLLRAAIDIIEETE